MGWEKLADLGAGVFKRWFSKEAKEESRANEIERLEQEQSHYSIHNLKGKYDKRLGIISKRLSALYRQAKNTR